MLENMHYPDKKTEQGWVHLNGRTVGLPLFDRRPVGKGIARDAWDNFLGSTAPDLGNAEPGSLMDQLKCPLGTAVNLGATSETSWRFGILAALQPLLTC